MRTALEIEATRSNTSDLDALARLYELGHRCARAGDDFVGCLTAILDTAIFVTAADKGNVQLFDPQTHELQIAAQRGFGRAFLEFFDRADGQTAAACGAALRTVGRVVVEDVTQSPLFAGQPSADVLLAEGVEAVQSTPLVSSTEHVLGMISTHFKRPTRLAERELRYMDLLARLAADYLERKQNERSLLTKQQQLERIADQTGALITHCSGELRYLFVNKPCAEFLGRPVDEIVGRTVADVLGEPAWQVVRPYIDRVLRGERVEYETEIPYEGAGVRYMHVIYTPDVDPIGAVRGWVGTVTDITERKRLEERIRIANRHKDEFLAMLSHELRNPLAPLRTSLELLARALRDDLAAKEPLSIAQRQTHHLTRLVDDLLDVSRIMQRQVALKQGPLEIGEAIDQAIEQARPLITQKGHHLRMEREHQRLFVSGDQARLVQCIANVLNNAAKYTPQQGQIQINVYGASDQVCVHVVDNGDGIGPDLLPHVFELFVQGERTLARTQGGLGVGLSIVKQVIELHGGTVRAESEGIGRGATFIIELPRVDDPIRAVEPALTKSFNGRAKRVLVIDDNVDAADSLAMLLTQEGHQTETAYAATDALDKARLFRPEVILLDIGLPHMDGYEVARRLQGLPELNGARLVAVTGYGHAEDRERTARAGFSHHLVKPADLTTLQEILAC